MKELSKSIVRRLADCNFINKYFIGKGIDIGGKPDPLLLYMELFPQIKDVKVWDLEEGDAQLMKGVRKNSYDFVHSSHCLEHLHDPIEGIKNWFRILKPGGYLVIIVPDEDLYEQGIFPSTYNEDHKWTFTIYKNSSWSKKSINIIELLKELGNDSNIIKIELLHSTYRFNLPRYDQTITPIGESGIEIIVQKKSNASGNKFLKNLFKHNKNYTKLKPYLNQYKKELQALANIELEE